MLNTQTELELLEAMGPGPSRSRFDAGRGGSRRGVGIHVAIRALSKSFESLSVLDGIDLTIESGEFVAIVGRSGCGKSTLLRMLTGLDRPSGGSIAFDGAVQSGLDDDVRIMFQDARLLPWKSVLENVALALPPSSRRGAREVLEQVGLGERAGEWPAVLSGGQRQRVALARALVHQPRLLLLDEPLGALDALTRIEMQGLIERLWRRRGFTALLVTHDVQEAIALADRVILLDRGRIALDLRVDLPRPRERGSPRFAELETAVLNRVLNVVPEVTANAFRGQVLEVVEDGVVAEVRVLTGVGTLTSLIAARDLADRNIRVGDEVIASFPPTEVAFADAPGGAARKSVWDRAVDSMLGLT